MPNDLGRDVADEETAAEQLALHLVASHLLSSPAARAAIVHTTGLDVARLHQLVAARLERGGGGGGGGRGRGAGARAEEALERLMVSRVFSFEGLAEAVEEVERSFEGRGGEGTEIPDPGDEEDGEQSANGGGIGLLVIDNFAAAAQWTKGTGFLACEFPVGTTYDERLTAWERSRHSSRSFGRWPT